MRKGNKFTVLSLLEPNRAGRTITRPKSARWFHRKNPALVDVLLAGAVQWPVGLAGCPRKTLMYTTS